VSLPAARVGAVVSAVTTMGFAVIAGGWLFTQQWLATS
jgi:hypothetical protein